VNPLHEIVNDGHEILNDDHDHVHGHGGDFDSPPGGDVGSLNDDHHGLGYHSLNDDVHGHGHGHSVK